MLAPLVTFALRSQWGAPQNLIAYWATGTRVDVAWDAVDGAGSYDIERDGTVIVSGHPTNSYSDTGMSLGARHAYRIRAVR